MFCVVIRALLRGKAHVEWKVLLSGERRTVKDDQYFVDERQIVWGEKNVDTTIPILPRGIHKFPFTFTLPESSLPCSFECRICYIRYYIKVTVDIPYASPPQGVKYFTVIGPHIDCMEEQYLVRVCTKKPKQQKTIVFVCHFLRNRKWRNNVKAHVVGAVNGAQSVYGVF